MCVASCLLYIFKFYFLYIHSYSSNVQIAILAPNTFKGNDMDKDLSHLWNIYSNEKDKKLEKNDNYSDKFSGKCNSETHTWTSNIGYCIQAELQSIYKA